MRKLLAILLCLSVMCFTFIGCSGNGDTESKPTVSSSEQSSSSDKQTSSVAVSSDTASSETTSDSTASTDASTEQTTNNTAADNEFVVLMPDKNSTEYFVRLDRPDAVYDVLVIGDEAYKSSLRYLSAIADAQNYQINLGYAVISQTATDAQLNSLKAGTAEYSFSLSEGLKQNEPKYLSLADILKHTKWDFVILTQSSINAGKASAYTGFNEFISEVKAKIPSSAKLCWSAPWAYADGCDNNSFTGDYNASHKDMLAAINSATAEYPAKNSNIAAVINTAALLDKLNTNGEYLEDGEAIMPGCGQYAVSLALFTKLTGISVDKIKWSSPCTEKQFKAIAAALK